jgi:hypothetical protein
MGVSAEHDRIRVKHVTTGTTSNRYITEYSTVKHMSGVATLILHNYIPFLI